MLSFLTFASIYTSFVASSGHCSYRLHALPFLLILDKDRQQAHTQQLNQQHQQQMLLQQHYMTTMFGNPHPAALAAAAAALSPQLNPAAAQLALNPAAAALAFRGFQATPNVTATTPPGSSAALLAAAAAAATGNPSAAAVVPPPGFPVSVGGMPTGTVSPVSTAPSSTVFPGVAVTQAMAAGLPSGKHALFSVSIIVKQLNFENIRGEICRSGVRRCRDRRHQCLHRRCIEDGLPNPHHVALLRCGWMMTRFSTRHNSGCSCQR